MFATAAGAIQQNENTDYYYWAMPGQSGCQYGDQYGEYIVTAYASVWNEGCVWVQAQAVYDSNGTLYNAPPQGGPNQNAWYESTANYQNIFGGNFWIYYDTTDYGELELFYQVSALG